MEDIVITWPKHHTPHLVLLKCFRFLIHCDFPIIILLFLYSFSIITWVLVKYMTDEVGTCFWLLSCSRFLGRSLVSSGWRVHSFFHSCFFPVAHYCVSCWHPASSLASSWCPSPRVNCNRLSLSFSHRFNVLDMLHCDDLVFLLEGDFKTFSSH